MNGRRNAILAAIATLVIAVYLFSARSGMLERLSGSRSETYYNLLVRGFDAGKLSLEREIPAGFSLLADPYDPVANSSYRIASNGLHDLSYYRDRLYLYFGITPALVLFGPFAVSTGHYLYHREAAAIFCSVGFLASLGLWRCIQRRYFTEAGAGAIAAGAIALGLATGLPMLLSRAEVYEVAISCGYMFTMLALGAGWCALHRPERRLLWLAAAGAAYGLALGARPSLLGGGVFLLIPALSEPLPAPRARAFLCALGPVALCGLALLFYNHRRFGQALEFGQRYQLASDRQDAVRHFSPHYLWFNFRVYFLDPMRCTLKFPFVRPIAPSPPPSGHGAVEDAFGILVDIPMLWLAAALPFAWIGRREGTRMLRRFVLAVAWVGGISAVVLCLYYVSCSRYEVEFLPEFVLLSLVGVLAVERALAGRPAWRRLARCGWGLLLGWSVVFNLFAAVEHYAEASNDSGFALMNAGRVPEAIDEYRAALRLNPQLVDCRVNLGSALVRSRQLPAALEEFSAALRLDPDNFAAQGDLGNALAQSGRFGEAIDHYREALRIEPGFAEFHFYLGSALAETGRLREAVAEYEQAVRLKPNFFEAHYQLGNALGNLGRLPDAVAHYEEALRLKAGYPEARANLGLALAEMNRTEEAIGQLKEALREKPGFAEAEAYLGLALARAGRPTEAVFYYEQALRSDPGNPDLHYNLGEVLRAVGRDQEARVQFEEARRLQAGR